MTDRVTSPAIRYHGGKFRLAPWVMEFFPDHRIYVEPFGGAAGVLIQKPRAYSEVYNDLDGDMVNFFRVVQNAGLRNRLIESLVMTPYAREEFELAWEPTDDSLERARRLIIRAQMGFGSAGARCSACPRHAGHIVLCGSALCSRHPLSRQYGNRSWLSTRNDQ